MMTTLVINKFVLPVQQNVPAGIYPNQCSLCGQRLVDETTSECANPHCPIKSTPSVSPEA